MKEAVQEALQAPPDRPSLRRNLLLLFSYLAVLTLIGAAWV